MKPFELGHWECSYTTVLAKIGVVFMKEISHFFPLVSFALEQSWNMWFGYFTNETVLEDILQKHA